jgi:hypothetical protein
MELWEVEIPTFSRQSANRWRWSQPYAPAAPYSPVRFLVLNSVRGWVDPRAMVRLEGLGMLKKSNNLIGNRARDMLISSNFDWSGEKKTQLEVYVTAHERLRAHLEIQMPHHPSNIYQTKNVFKRSCKEEYRKNNPHCMTNTIFSNIQNYSVFGLLHRPIF